MLATPGALAGAGRDGVEQVEEIALVIIQEGEDLLDDVNRPSEDAFMRDPGGVAFAEILEGDWFLPCSVVLVIGSEQVINVVKEMSRHRPSLCWPFLDYTNEVI